MKRNGCGVWLELVPAIDAVPVFSEEHSCCESCTVGVGATRASKMVSDLIKGGAPNGPQFEGTMIESVEDPVALLALGDNSREMQDTSTASEATID